MKDTRQILIQLGLFLQKEFVSVKKVKENGKNKQSLNFKVLLDCSLMVIRELIKSQCFTFVSTLVCIMSLETIYKNLYKNTRVRRRNMDKVRKETVRKLIKILKNLLSPCLSLLNLVLLRSDLNSTSQQLTSVSTGFWG